MADGNHRDPWTHQPLSRDPMMGGGRPLYNGPGLTCDECGYTVPTNGSCPRGGCTGIQRYQDKRREQAVRDLLEAAQQLVEDAQLTAPEGLGITRAHIETLQYSVDGMLILLGER